MSAARSFRFATGAYATGTAAEFGEKARRIEDLGYTTLLMPDHFERDWFALGPALVAAANATTTLRVGSIVYCNNFRHPALLAREAATIDVLSDGRLEFGIGAGYDLPEYHQTGIPVPDRGERVGRLREALAVVKGLWDDGPFSFDGKYYTISEMDGWPKPRQQPHPPIQIGGGGRQILELAATQADIVGIIAQSVKMGGIDVARDTDALVAKKVNWVRAAAGDRFPDLQLAVLIWRVVITDHKRAAAEELAHGWGLTEEQVLASPYFLIGSQASIIEDVLALRERHDISHVTVMPEDAETFAPIAAELAGA